MGPIIAGDKVQVVDRRRVQGCDKRCSAGIGYRAWGETSDEIGIIGRPLFHIPLSEIAVEVLDVVDNGGITAKRYPALQTIVKNGRDERAFFWKSRLLLDN